MAEILLVVADAVSPSAGSVAVRDRLRDSLEHTVTLVDPAAADTNAIGKAAVVIAEDVSATTLGSKYRTVAVPLLCLKGPSWDDLSFSSVAAGSSASGTQNFVSGAPLSGELSGPQMIAGGGAIGVTQIANEANLGPGAVISARRASQTSGSVVLFSYELGSEMASGFMAPARRAAWGIHTDVFDTTDDIGINATGWSVFDTIIAWLLSPPAGNQPPTVDAGADQTGILPGATVTLTATANDPEDGELQYEWQQTGGVSVTLADPTSASTTFVAPASGGTLTFLVTVTDPQHATASDIVEVAVKHPPTAYAGTPQQVAWGSTVTLDGSGSADVDGTIASYQWIQVGGTSVELANADTSTPTFTAPSANTELVFRLTVTDDDGVASTNDALVYITVANTSAGVLLVVGQTSPLSAAGQALYDRLHDTFGYSVTAVRDSANVSAAAGKALVVIAPDVTTANIGNRYANVAVPLFCLNGRSWVDLHYTATSGTNTSSNVHNFVSGAPLSAGLSGTHNVGDSGGTGTAMGLMQLSNESYLGPDALIAARRASAAVDFVVLWSYDAHSLMANDFYAPARRVAWGLSSDSFDTSDNVGLSPTGWSVFDNAVAWLLGSNFGNLPPTIDAGANQTSVMPGDHITLTATAADPEEGALSYRWQQLSGAPVVLSDDTSATTTFTIPGEGGTYVFRAIARDASGITATDTVTVTAAQPPTAHAGYNQTVLIGSTVTLDGSGSADVDGTIASYQWIQVGGTSVELSSATVMQPTFTAPEVADDMIFSLTVTDSQGLTSLNEATVRITTAVSNSSATAKIRVDGQWIERPVMVRSDGAWI